METNEYKKILTEWHHKIMCMSSTHQALREPQYEQLVNAGKDLLPTLFSQWQEGNFSVFDLDLVVEITGEGIPDYLQNTGDIMRIRNYWEGWAIINDHIEYFRN